MDWSRLANMFNAYGLDNLAAEALQHGRSRELRRQIDDSAQRVQNEQVAHLIKRAREAERQAKVAVPTDKPTDATARAVCIGFEDLPSDLQEFVEVMVRQADLGALYTTRGTTARGASYECTASMYEERFGGAAERYVVLLVQSDRAMGKAVLTYRQQGATWRRSER